MEKTFFTEVSWKLVRDEGRECVLTIRGLLPFDSQTALDDPLASALHSPTRSFAKLTENAEQRAAIVGRNERFSNETPRLVRHFHSHRMDDARNALPRTPRAARTRRHRTRRWKNSTTMEEWRGRLAGEETIGESSRYRMEKSRTRAPTDVQAHDGLTSAWKNPRFEMAMGWECLYIGKTCSDLFPRCSNKVRFTIGQQLFRAAIAPKTRGRNDASPSFACPFLLHADGKHGFRSPRPKEQIFLLEFRR